MYMNTHENHENDDGVFFLCIFAAKTFRFLPEKTIITYFSHFLSDGGLDFKINPTFVLRYGREKFFGVFRNRKNFSSMQKEHKS